MVRFSVGRAWAMAIAIVSTIRKPDHSKSEHFCLDFQWLLTKQRPFVWISNDRASGFQIPFKIWTICKPTSFWPLKIQTSPNFRSPLYFDQLLGTLHSKCWSKYTTKRSKPVLKTCHQPLISRTWNLNIWRQSPITGLLLVLKSNGHYDPNNGLYLNIQLEFKSLYVFRTVNMWTFE